MLKAIIIDGNAISRDLLRQVLANGGYQVVGQTNAAPQGLALTLKHQPHIICIDMQIFEDDPQLLGRIQNALPKTLIFMVSSQLGAQDVQAALARGVHGFIIKPFNTAAVLTTIKNAVLALIKKQQAQVAQQG
jgi:two-component system chemotaxis response regulator CheY